MSCCRLHVHVSRFDPTGTHAIQERFEADAARRFNKLALLIQQKIVKEDGFGLAGITSNRRDFAFPRDEQKIAGFMAWLRQAERENILTVTRVGNTPNTRPWTSLYIETAYKKALLQSSDKLKKQGVGVSDKWIRSAFDRPIHADRVFQIYARTYSDLQKITGEMESQISRVLAQGLAEGRGAEDLARRLSDRVKKIGITRARMMARTEVVSAHSEATLNVYQEAGIEGVEVEAEWLTAADPCQLCIDLKAAGPYTIRAARDMIPAHPNCRCAWAPKVKGGSGIELT